MGRRARPTRILCGKRQARGAARAAAHAHLAWENTKRTGAMGRCARGGPRTTCVEKAKREKARAAAARGGPRASCMEKYKAQGSCWGPAKALRGSCLGSAGVLLEPSR
eukprot:9203139-Pyramimonas_sp.AAC.1